MSVTAIHAVRAAKNTHRWGLYAAARYAAKRGVPPRLLILAMSLEAQQ